MRFVLAGGGTGGHLVPGLALAAAIRGEGGEALFVTAGRPVEQRILGGEPALALPLERGGGAPGLLGMGLRMPGAIRRARGILDDFKPDAVIGLGGLASFPVAVAARRARIPVGLLEINAVAGRATRWLAPFADRVFVASDAAARKFAGKAVITGAPLRPSFLRLPDRAGARVAFGLDPAGAVLLVLGGSQGAGSLNGWVSTLLPEFARRKIQLMWVCGPGKDAEARARCTSTIGLRSLVFDFVDETAPLFAAADVALCRSGAATVAELAAAGLPAIAVPYPHHRDRQQTWNARLLGDGAVILEERGLTAPILGERLFSIFENAAARLSMSQACLRAAKPRAAQGVLGELASLVRMQHHNS